MNKNMQKYLLLLLVSIGSIKTANDNTFIGLWITFYPPMTVLTLALLYSIYDKYSFQYAPVEVQLARTREYLKNPDKKYEQFYKKQEARLEQQLKEERERLQADHAMQNQFTVETSKKLQEMIHPKKTDKQTKEENQSFFFPPGDLVQNYNGFFSSSFIRYKNSLGRLLVHPVSPVLRFCAENNQEKKNWNRVYDPNEDCPFM